MRPPNYAVDVAPDLLFRSRTYKSCAQVENFRAAFHDPVGTMELLECDLTIDSNDLAIVISGKAPVVGKVFVKMHGKAFQWGLHCPLTSHALVMFV